MKRVVRRHVTRSKSGASRQASEPASRVARSGAVQAKTRIGDVSQAWWAHHKSSAAGSLRRLLSTPLQTLMTALVVAIALALPATLWVGLNNVYQLGHSWDTSPKISVYLQAGAKENAIIDFRQRLSGLAGIEQVQYISPEQAVEEFQRTSGFGEALTALEENPLPPSFVVTPAATSRAPAELQKLVERLEQEPLVDEVGLDMAWVRRLQELMVLGKQIVYALGFLLALGALLAVGNTIRLAIENRRDEIVVIKLVGGTNGFVRRPFLYSGGWYGLIGGALACLLVAAGFWALSGTVARLAATYQSDFRLQGLGIGGSLVLLVLSGLLGWLGAWLAVGRHLSQIEPR